LAPPATVRTGSSVDLAVDVTNPRPGDVVTFTVAAGGGSDVVATLTGPVSGTTATAVWTVDAGTRTLPLAVTVTAALRGQTIDVGPTTIVSGTRFSTLGWLTSAGQPPKVDGQDGMLVAGGGDQLVLKFDVDDGAGGALKDAIDLTFILQRKPLGGGGGFTEVGRGTDQASGVVKFERKFNAPNDASVPGIFQIVVEARLAGQTGPPSIGTRTSPPLKLLVVPPVITVFQVDESSHALSQPAERVGLGPGQTAQLFWTIVGRVDDVRLDPGNRDVLPFMSLAPGRNENSGVMPVDPAADPPDASGHYTLTAKNLGAASGPRQVAVVAVTTFEIAMKSGQPPTATGEARVLTAPDGSTPVPKVSGRPGHFAPAPPSSSTPALPRVTVPKLPPPGFMGQVTPSSTVVFTWSLAGVGTMAGSSGAAGGADVDTKVELLLNGFTAPVVAIITASGTLEVADVNPATSTKTFLDAELKVFATDPSGAKRDEVSSALIRLRENFPFPKFAAADGFQVFEDKRLIPDGGVAHKWDDLSFHWHLEGGFTFNKVLMTVTDENGVVSPEIELKASGDASPTGSKKVPFPAGLSDKGKLRCTAILMNLFNAVSETRSTTFTLSTIAIEVLDPGGNVKSAVGIGLWDSAFDPATDALRNAQAETANFVGSDLRRFRFRVNDPAAKGKGKVTLRWLTRFDAGGDDDAPASKDLTLTEGPAGSGIFASNFVMLTADPADKATDTHTGLASNPVVVSAGAADHRLRNVTVDGTHQLATHVAWEYPIPGGGPVVPGKIDVFSRSPEERKRLRVHLVNVRKTAGSAGSGIAPAARVTDSIANLRQIYAVCGIFAEVDSFEIDPPASCLGWGPRFAGTDPDPSVEDGARPGGILTPSPSQTDVMNAVRARAGFDPHDVYVVWVAHIYKSPVGATGPVTVGPGGASFPDFLLGPKSGGVPTSVAAGFAFSSVPDTSIFGDAHEATHNTQNDWNGGAGHFALSPGAVVPPTVMLDNHNLMKGFGITPAHPFDEPQRLWETMTVGAVTQPSQITAILGSRFLRPY
jgi:hypothetical protein